MRDYSVMKKSELKKLAKEAGVGKYYALNKTALIEALTSLEAEKGGIRRPTLTNKEGYRFGRHISEGMIVELVSEIWKGVFTVSEVIYDGHYWWGTVHREGTEDKAEGIRMDYLINYHRPPRPFARDPEVKERRAALSS